MTADLPSLRVLAVDDLEPIRLAIARVLTSAGYRVDVAASLAEARGMDPGGYDVILVDAFLGQEQGSDLIDEMVAADPAAAGRCLLVTGGVLGEAPHGVARLEKPFDQAGLLSAVHALHRSDAAGLARPHSASTAAPEPAPDRESGVAAETSPRSPASQAAAWPLLALVRRVRAAERAATADFVHDGPIQDLTAALLGLGATGQNPDGQQPHVFGNLRGQLEAAARSLRQLMEAGNAVGPGGMDLAGTLRQHAAWLPFSPVTVELHPSVAGGSPGRAALTGELVELVLFALADHFPGGGVNVVVRAGKQTVEIEVRPSPADGTPPDPGADADVPSLRELARALGGTAHAAPRGTGWHAWFTIPGN